MTAWYSTNYQNRRRFRITGSVDGIQTDYQLPIYIYRYLAEHHWVDSPSGVESEAMVYGIIGDEVFWANNFAGSNIGHIYKTNLTTRATTTLYTGDHLAVWQATRVGNDFYAVGEETDGGAHARATLYRINTAGVTAVFMPNTDDCNELIGVDNDGTYIYAGERAIGGVNDSTWPDGGGLWKIPIATYSNTGTWARVHEDPNNYGWRSMVVLGDRLYAYLGTLAVDGRFKIQSAPLSDLTTWTVHIDKTAQNVGNIASGNLSYAGGMNLIAAGVDATDNRWHIYTYDGAWHDYDSGLVNAGGPGVQGLYHYYDYYHNRFVFYICDGNQLVGATGFRSLYQTDFTVSAVLSVNTSLTNLATLDGSRIFDNCYNPNDGAVYTAIRGTPPCSIYRVGVFADDGVIALDGKGANWPLDIRFTKSDGITLLDHWVEEVSAAANYALVWVEFDSIPADPDTVDFYLYFNYGAAADASNGANTFILFDDFERGNNGDPIGGSWTVQSGGATISTDHAFGGSRSGKIAGHAATTQITIPKAAGSGYAMRVRAWKETAVTVFYYLSQGNGTKVLLCRADVNENLIYNDGADQDTGVDTIADAWCLHEMSKISFVTYLFDWHHNGVKIVNQGGMWPDAAYVVNMISFHCQDLTVGHDVYIDDFIVRNWTLNEPLINPWYELEWAPNPGVFSDIPTRLISGGMI